MRSYGQFCSIARALDVIGDRWTPLIIRELLLRGACRYTDLKNGLPGIATNLLADRLRELEAAGVIPRGGGPAAGRPAPGPADRGGRLVRAGRPRPRFLGDQVHGRAAGRRRVPAPV